MFLDSAALTFLDPDHSEDENRAITIGRSAQQRVLFVAHTEREDRTRIISARRATQRSNDNIRKGSNNRRGDDLRPEYDLARLKGGVRGKYYRRVMAGTNLVLLEPDVARAFPDSDSVNERSGYCTTSRPRALAGRGGRPTGAGARP